MMLLISMRTVESATYPETRDALSHDWTRLLAELGVTPLLVPNVLKDASAYLELGASGLVLTGGDDLGSDEMPTPRDSTETRLLTGALAKGLPILGVCRGLQMINRHFGGRITRKLPEAHIGPHDIRLADQRLIAVNSFHNHGVMHDGLAPDLQVFAETVGGVIEGFRHSEFPIVAVQWHPERPNPARAFDRELLRDWLTRCD